MKNLVNNSHNTIKRFNNVQDFSRSRKSCLSHNKKNLVQTIISENYKELAI